MGDTRYENIRDSLGESMRRASDAQIEALLETRGLSADMAEGFLDDIGRMAPGIGRAVLKAAPSVLPVAGTLLGGAFGGPIGASLGGSLGQLAGGAIASASGAPGAGGARTPTPAPAAPVAFAPPVANPAVTTTPAPPPGVEPMVKRPPALPVGTTAAAAPATSATPAAGQLLQAISRPETLRALVSMAMGPAGTVNVNVGSTPVPVAAFANLIGILSSRAATEYAQEKAEATAPEYMRDPGGEPTGDPAVAADRAAALYDLLARTLGDTVDAADSEAVEAEAESAEAESESEAEAWELMELIESFEGTEAAQDAEAYESAEAFEASEAIVSAELSEALAALENEGW